MVCGAAWPFSGGARRAMLVLFDTPAGHALFRLKKPDKLKDPDSLDKSFSDVESAHKLCAAACHHR